ncbi:hypothetical protein BpHYR1_052214 [Brachionus plicatilis]|uniref:Uncharacterized protein n=1 Tax=Brachionus plicatilis TaxID=10195 RepID=A0A3M7R2H1_BRAPC|nr:hypothetical protein BpHYR1_052214 [Brachionus plicatilis]
MYPIFKEKIILNLFGIYLKLSIQYIASNELQLSLIKKKEVYGSSRLGEQWFIYYWNNFCSQVGRATARLDCGGGLLGGYYLKLFETSHLFNTICKYVNNN